MSKYFHCLYVLALFWMACVPAVFAEEPRFSLPVDCEPGRDCWIVKYVDVETDKGKVRDYRCGPHTHDEHKGTDIAVKDLVTMEQGVDVLAAENGTVARIRDGVDDMMPDADDIISIKKNNVACGNGVFIDHGQGWQTIYCHLKKGSLRVKAGDVVRRGQTIAEIGHSGLSEFPHLHFGVFHDGKTIDPFTGRKDSEGCGHSGKDLWRSDSLYRAYFPPAIMAAGFTASVPDYEAVKIDSHSPVEFGRLNEALFFWVNYYGAQENDIIVMEVFAPDGSKFSEKTIVQPKYRARQFYYIGRRTNTEPYQHGLYQGVVTITRFDNGQKITQDIKRAVYVGKP